MRFRSVIPGVLGLLVSFACTGSGPSSPPELKFNPTVPPQEIRRTIRIPEGSTGLFEVTSGDMLFSESCLEDVAEAMATPTASPSPTPPSAPTAPAAPTQPVTATPPATPTPQPTATPERRGLFMPGPAPFFPLEMEEDEELRDRLMSVLEDEEDGYAFVVKDLSTGRGATHNADKNFYAASLFKLFVMYEVFRQQASGSVNWQDELLITPYYESQGLGPRETALCQVLTVSEAMQAMMRISDNSAAHLLQDLVGPANVNQSLQALGILDSGLYSVELPSTASDVALLLEAIANGEAISEAASAEMVELMASELIDNGLRAGVPSRVKVAHKTGKWTGAAHDAGIVFAESGPYLFVAMSEADYETELIEELSREAWEHFRR